METEAASESVIDAGTSVVVVGSVAAATEAKLVGSTALAVVFVTVIGFEIVDGVVTASTAPPDGAAGDVAVTTTGPVVVAERSGSVTVVDPNAVGKGKVVVVVVAEAPATTAVASSILAVSLLMGGGRAVAAAAWFAEIAGMVRFVYAVWSEGGRKCKESSQQTMYPVRI